MAARNPLNRVAVAPVDIYNQAPEPVQEAPAVEPKPAAKKHDRQEVAKVAKKLAATAEAPQTEVETDSPYSTYLFKHQVKGIKLRAIEQDVNDKDVVQQAVDEYFKNHPL